MTNVGRRWLDKQQLRNKQGATAAKARIPIAFITAHDDDAAQKQAMENGATAWLMKPVNENELLGAIGVVSSWHEGIEEEEVGAPGSKEPHL